MHRIINGARDLFSVFFICATYSVCLRKNYWAGSFFVLAMLVCNIVEYRITRERRLIVILVLNSFVLLLSVCCALRLI